MHGELVVSMLVSVGLMALMVKALAFPPKPQTAHVRETVHCSCAERPENSPIVSNSQPQLIPTTSRRAIFLEGLRRSLAKYQDCRAALADNYLSRASDETQDVWEFTNYWYGFKAAFDFDPAHPTSLIYRRDLQGQYTLIGVAFTAPERFTPEQRTLRIPADIADWEPHGIFGWVARIYFNPQAVEVAGECNDNAA